MADISTGRQRGIVPFVDETTGRLPDQYLPQGVIDLQGDLEQAVTDAGASATAAKASETAAKASADSATQSASAATQSAESASGDASAAKASAGEAASSASTAKSSETAAASSATAAADSASAAKASETAAAQSAQTATEQVSSIGDSVERAAASATAAAQSASQAQSSATAADSSAQAAAASAESAQTAAESAASSKDAAAQSASEASASAQAAETSKTNAAASASAAEAAKTNAAASASAAKVSETNAADSATAAQNAVDGFGLMVGTTTTGEPGSDAAVEIQKNGAKYTANFTIPRGDKGADGVNENVPLGTASGVVAHASDAYPALPRKVQVHGATSGGNSVEPKKLTILGENLLDLSFINHDNYNPRVSGDEVIFILDADGNNDTYTYNDVTGDPYSGDTKYLIPVVPNSRLHFKAETSEPITSSSICRFYSSEYNILGDLVSINASGNIQSGDFDVPANAAFISVRLGVKDAQQDTTITMRNICLSYTDIEYVPPEKIETNLPSDISLTDGDTLAIDRDGTTRIVHSEGEPTVLENVTLPELPAPTFNVYTTGGSIHPTVDVDYEQDVNLVLQALEAKVAALQVADKTN